MMRGWAGRSSGVNRDVSTPFGTTEIFSGDVP
jgi:hypothetical protein